MKTASILCPGVFKTNLKRFWPLWLAGFVALVMGFDVPVYTAAASIAHTSTGIYDRVSLMNNAWSIVRLVAWFYALVGAIVVALALGEHLFDSSAATFVGSLPVKRRAVFATHALLGLAVLVVLPTLAAACLLPLYASLGSVFSLGGLGKWLAVAVALSVVFYALALLSCHLAGTRAVALLLYGVINMLACCLEFAGNLLVSALMYGIPVGGSMFDWLSPALWMGQAATGWGKVSQPLWGHIAAYLVAAVAVLVLTNRLYDRRDLEKAGDSISFAPLRPVLKYLAGISLALLFGTIYRLLSISEPLSGLPMSSVETLVLTLMLAAGGFLGVLFAEMIMSRSAHVLARCWRGGLVLVVAAVAFVGVCRFDVLGRAHAVPAASDVEEVLLASDYSGSGMTITSPERVSEVCDLHRAIIDFGGHADRNLPYTDIRITYKLKGGRAMVRVFPVPSNFFDARDGGVAPDQGAQLMEGFERIANSAEGRASRFDSVLGTLDKSTFVQLEYLVGDGQYLELRLTDAELADLMAGALREDLMSEPAGEVFAEVGDNYEQRGAYDAHLTVQKILPDQPQGEYQQSTEMLLFVQLGERSTPHVVAWLHEHHPEVKLQPWL